MLRVLLLTAVAGLGLGLELAAAGPPAPRAPGEVQPPAMPPAITWTVSVEGDTFQARPVGAAAGRAAATLAAAAAVSAAPRDDICVPIANKDCWGNDIKRHQANSAADCCALCKSTPGCGAWTFDTTPSHAPTCNVKSKCGNTTAPHTKVTAVSGVGVPTPGPAPAPPQPPVPAPGAALHLTINTSATLQTMEGFGGCFNEKGWDALSALNETARAAVMRAMFGKDGLRWGVNRMPIGSSDFADNYYSLDDNPGDFAIDKLSLARDNERLLPFIKAAMAVNPALKVWGSPWTGPEWLKDSAPQAPKNEGCGSLNQDPKYQAAYALYLAKAAIAYRAAGLNFEHLAIQNEPNQGGRWSGGPKGHCGDSYPKMRWTGEQLVRPQHCFIYFNLHLSSFIVFSCSELPNSASILSPVGSSTRSSVITSARPGPHRTSPTPSASSWQPSR